MSLSSTLQTGGPWSGLIPLLLQLPNCAPGEPDWDAADPHLLQAIGQIAEQMLQNLPLQLDGLAQLMVRLDPSDAASLRTSAVTELGLVFWHLADVMETSQALLAEIAPRVADFEPPLAHEELQP